MKDYKKTAINYFLQGYNCAQAVLLTFSDEIGLDSSKAILMASSMGGGIGGMREVCGAVSSMCLAAGALYGYDDPKNAAAKKEHYRRIQLLADKFSERNGSLICRDLLSLPDAARPQPRPRTQEYYKNRPCAKFCGDAAEILAEYIKENPIK